MEKDGEYMGSKIDYVNSGHARQTQLQSSALGDVEIVDGISVINQRLTTLN